MRLSAFSTAIVDMVSCVICSHASACGAALTRIIASLVSHANKDDVLPLSLSIRALRRIHVSTAMHAGMEHAPKDVMAREGVAGSFNVLC
tara:strand:+ start:11922 stop:12191 length:270 start_codon:yes stop_codon:yes gene_type:complete